MRITIAFLLAALVSVTDVSTGAPGAWGAPKSEGQPEIARPKQPTESAIPRWSPPSQAPVEAVDTDCWAERIEESRAKLGDAITVVVINFEAYAQWAIAEDAKHQRSSENRTIGNLVLYLNDQPMLGIRPSRTERFAVTPTKFTRDNKEVRLLAPSHHVQFRLVRTKQSNDVWASLLDRPKMSRDVTVSVGFPDLGAIATNIQPGPNGFNRGRRRERHLRRR